MHSTIKKAMEFAQKAHSNKMYDQYPYFKHLEDVYKVGIAHGLNETDHLDILVSLWLHDSMEDCGVSYSDLKKSFNEEIAENVKCVSDNITLRNRKEKKEESYPRIRSRPDSVVIKLCDRIANTQNSIAYEVEESERHFSTMYKKEYRLFRWNLHVIDHAQDLWKTLDNLMEWDGY
jgi:guanosine-3',5'-bis(diphosphate) 3'-pyrophosphohydrolase